MLNNKLSILYLIFIVDLSVIYVTQIFFERLRLVTDKIYTMNISLYPQYYKY